MKIDYKEQGAKELVNDTFNYYRKEIEEKYNVDDGWFGVFMYLYSVSDFKEIKQIRAYNAETVIGNAGGYIVILVGYTLSGLPLMILTFFKSLKNAAFIQKFKMRMEGQERK